MIPVLLSAFALLLPDLAAADVVKAATASNFRDAMSQLVSAFEKTSDHTVVPVFGSTGKHFSQIVNGAPFDVFLAADNRRPKVLEQDGLTVPETRFTYAIGQLVLWSPREGYVDADGHILGSGNFRHLAIANPDLAPYGAAAKETLENLGLWQNVNPSVVSGENIGQAFLFVHSGNAELGFVARSQLIGGRASGAGSMWRVPPHLHAPIEQQAVLLRDTAAAREFLSFMRGAEAAAIIRAQGYTPVEDGGH
ncbi:MAG: molybdate ABC transporter substrate-binding protein [Gammaproteobacteria bacterium]|nr:molybdate ABC transporter substrate-binding protein [Gammaproteobacteria bacterium]